MCEVCGADCKLCYTTGVFFMPLLKGSKAKSKKSISENITREIDSVKDVKQAAAIAYSVSGKSKKKK